MPADKNDSVLVVETPHATLQQGFDSLQERAWKLAEQHEVRSEPGIKPRLTDFLNDYQALVREVVQYFRGAADQELAVSYAAEWVLDNYYLVLQTLRQVEESLPDRYYVQLPKLASGDLKGYQRIYAIAREICTIQNARLDIEDVSRFIQAYEIAAPITMGELWALPTMLRLCTVQALVGALQKLTPVKADLNAGSPVLIEFDEEVSEEEIVANSFSSLRLLDAQDWEDFFEKTSQVEQILREDPSGFYPKMDFETRDRYRKEVEDLALHSGTNESKTAKAAVHLAGEAAMRGEGLRQTHLGYYLVDKGRHAIEEALDYRTPLAKRAGRWVLAHPALVYLGSTGIVSYGLVGLIVVAAFLFGGTKWQILAAALVSLIPAVSLAVDLMNVVITSTIKPRILPKLDYSEGIPADQATLVVIPALLHSQDEIIPLLQQLELHSLRNSDPRLFFGLLTDFEDAPSEHIEGDEDLLRLLEEGIDRLNSGRGQAGTAPFLLLHRERRWNAKEQVWMGWERKRGKLHELNSLILGDRQTSFRWQFGSVEYLQNVKYVITLDSDTILPLKGANRLVGTLAHPLNQALFDAETGTVKAGYTILQPRTEVNPTVANKSVFSRVYSGDTGLDLYTMAVSDVYQDLFGEGIYVGKGIYDVAAFERSLSRRIPENSLLSHDLFEGIQGRAGLVTDIVLVEDYPGNYSSYVQRIHRWQRGDWQLLPWLFPSVPAAPSLFSDEENPRSRRIPNQLSPIDRWKLLDNLRRSLLFPTLLLYFLVGWVWLPGSALFWTIIGLLPLSFTFLVSSMRKMLQVAGQMIQPLLRSSTAVEPPRTPHRPVWKNALRWLLALAFLPYEAFISLDAVITTLVRLFITRRRLLEWTTSARTSRLLSNYHLSGAAAREMSLSRVFSLGFALLVGLINISAMPAAAPLLIIWALSPEIVSLINRPLVHRPARLPENDRVYLRRLARRTWLFFEQYLSPEDHWLPPDHFQENPKGVVAHRTSPTNIGLALNSVLAAYDFGYLGILDFTVRLRTILDSMDKLDKHRGHYLNWYDTRTLEPLPPRYVSTVDSGNLAASLINLGEGCLELAEAQVLRWETWQGLLDTLDLLLEPISNIPGREAGAPREALKELLLSIRQQILDLKTRPTAWTMLASEKLGDETWNELDRRLMDLVYSSEQVYDPEIMRRLGLVARSVRSMVDSARREMDLLLPWLKAFDQMPSLFSSPSLPPLLEDELLALRGPVSHILKPGAGYRSDTDRHLPSAEYGQRSRGS
jgi:cyclic beta-1,2-glucan synthetase